MSAEQVQTVYGKMSSAFSFAKLAELCLEKSGVQTGPFGSQLHNEDYVDEGTPIITVEHLSDNRILHENTPKVSDADRERLSKYSLTEGDIVFSRVGSVDRRALVRQQEDGWLFSGRCLRVRPKSEIIDSAYLSYFFGHEGFRSHIRGIAVGATMPSINTKILSDIPIYFPDLDAQRRIACVLSSLDDKIELNRQINQTLEQMAQAIFKSWFVDFDPVHAKVLAIKEGRDPIEAAARVIGNLVLEQVGSSLREIAELFPSEFVESELGLIPKGWGVKSLDQIADYLNGLACQKYPPEEGKSALPVIKIRELRQGITENTDKATSGVPSSYIVNDGDVLFSWSGSLLIDIWTQGQGVLNQHLFKVTSKTYPKWFYFYWTDYHLAEFQNIAAHKATTMGHIKRHHLRDAKCFVADEALLKIADKQISPLLDLRINNEKEVNKLATLRDTLLPKLLSGEIRVIEAEQLCN